MECKEKSFADYFSNSRSNLSLGEGFVITVISLMRIPKGTHISNVEDLKIMNTWSAKKSFVD